MMRTGRGAKEMSERIDRRTWREEEENEIGG